jgi:hemolysin III
MGPHAHVTELEDMIDPAVVKPRFRGKLHRGAFIAAIPAGALLVAWAPSPRARIAVFVYAVSLVALYGTSAAYHRIQWSARARRWMKRLDHSMIFVLIAGTYTPLALLVLHGAWSVVILSIVWGGAALGTALKMVRIDGLRAVAGGLYICMGWLAIVAMPQMVRGLSGVGLSLMFTGGVLYTLGSIVLATHKPDPSSAVFGYHEVWHSLVIAGSLCHFVMISLVLRSGA